MHKEEILYRPASQVAVRPGMAETPLVHIENVWKELPGAQAGMPVLRGVYLDVYPGQMVALAGPSGSGKSTLLGLLGGLDIPTYGGIVIDGIEISRLPESKLADLRNRRIGFIFQFFNLIPALTVLENVILPAQFASGPISSKPEERALRLLQQVGLADRSHRKPGELSGGEQQRVAIARALINEPPLILADEPTGNLDSATGRAVLDLLFEIRRQRKLTCIIATHDPALAARADRVVTMYDGILI